MKAGYLVFGFLVVGGLAFYLGHEISGNKDTAEKSRAAVAKKMAPGKLLKPKALQKASPIFNVPVGNAPCEGPADAKVTIIEFSDFQCPFCKRVEPTVDQVLKTYGQDVRRCWKDNPLPFHKNAQKAAEAAWAAGEQGKFWEMHDKMYANQKAIAVENLTQYAKELGLDMTKFQAALDSGKFKAQTDKTKAQGAQFGARGTPAFFINGAFLSGAQPFAKFKDAVDKAIVRADKVLAKGVSKAQLYTELVKNGKSKAAPPKPRQRPGQGTGRQMVSFPSHVPCFGPKDAKVTIVEFSDFQCPYCGRVEPTIKKIKETYKNDVRFCFRQNPLSFHKDAHLAATASMAAGEQGKFWEMHDKMYANQRQIKRPDLEKYAQELGLNMSKFKAALDNNAFDAQIAQDQKEAMKLGSRGTPGFFINGLKVSGAQPFARFKSVIDGDLKKADELIKKGTPKSQIYAALVKADPWKPGAAPMKRAAKPVDKGPVIVDVKGSPVRGAKNAKVTIVEFSEFQCPFCKRVEPTLAKLLDEYKGKVKLVFKHNPLPFHPFAEGASKAALAAGYQGKFWEMHDKLYANQKALKIEDLKSYAKELGLNMSKFEKDMNKPAVAEKIKKDKADAAKAGARGTPTFFINGQRFVGAQPIDNFKKIIDAKLKAK